MAKAEKKGRTRGASDIHMRYTDKDGKTWVDHHRVWSRELFVAAQEAAYAKEKGKAEVVDEATYKAERKR